MPPIKNRKLIEFEFDYEGCKYKFTGFQIRDINNLYVCDCDITAYKMDYTEDNLRVCCKIVLDAYYMGKRRGMGLAKQEIRDFLGIR